MSCAIALEISLPSAVGPLRSRWPSGRWLCRKSPASSWAWQRMLSGAAGSAVSLGSALSTPGREKSLALPSGGTKLTQRLIWFEPSALMTSSLMNSLLYHPSSDVLCFVWLCCGYFFGYIQEEDTSAASQTRLFENIFLEYSRRKNQEKKNSLVNFIVWLKLDTSNHWINHEYSILFQAYYQHSRFTRSIE